MGLSILKAWFLGIALVVAITASTILFVVPAVHASVTDFSLSSTWVFAQTSVPETQPRQPEVSQPSESEDTPTLTPDRDAQTQPTTPPKATPKPSAKVDRAAGPYDMEAIKAFDRAVYGTE